MSIKRPVYVSVQAEDFDVGHEIQRLSAQDRSIGGIVSFVGLVRDLNLGDTVGAMTLEHYPGMTERALTEIAQHACQRWPLNGVSLIHRHGRLLPGDQIVLVIAAGHHRGEVFQACEFMMDYLKTQAPFWKKEETTQGEARWVDARETDQTALQRWQR